MTGGCRSEMCGRSNACCSISPTARFGAPTGGFACCAPGIARTASSTDASRPIIAVANTGRNCRGSSAIRSLRRRSSIEIEVAGRLGDRLVPRLAQGLFEAFRQRITARPFGRHRLLEDRLAARRLLGQDPLGIGQLWPIRTNGLFMPYDAAQIGINDERGLTAWARDVEFR